MVLADATLILEFTDTAAQELDLDDPQLRVVLDVEPAQIAEVAEGLARVFAGTAAKTRPARIELGSADLRTYAGRARSKRKARRTRIMFEVVGRRGTLVDSRRVGGMDDKIDSTVAKNLARWLHVDEETLVGLRYTVDLLPDNWGTTYSKFQLVKTRRSQ